MKKYLNNLKYLKKLFIFNWYQKITNSESTLNYVSKEGKEFTIQLLPSDSSLTIKILENEDILGGYKITKELEDFKKLGRCFKIFDKILEIREFLEESIKEKKNFNFKRKWISYFWSWNFCG